MLIKIAEPIIDKEEIIAVNKVLESGLLAQGPKVEELEKNFAEYCGTKYAIAVNSGTAAIHSALFATGIQPGDEVITTPFSFIATVNPILILGARPVFVDVNPTSFNIDEDSIEAAITSNTKALLPVHLYGQPYNHSKMNKIASKYKLRVIEDACQSIGAEFNGAKTGSLGDLGCFSLYATKNIMCGEGGIVTTNNPAYADTIRRFRQHGMNSQYSYEHYGYNYRLTDLQAAIAVEQLKKADNFNKLRTRNATLYNNYLGNVRGIILPKIISGRSHVFHQYTIRITDEFPVSRDELAAILREKDVITGIYYPRGLHESPHLKKLGYRPGDFPNSEMLSRQVLSLPVHPRVSEGDVKHVSGMIKDISGKKK